MLSVFRVIRALAIFESASGGVISGILSKHLAGTNWLVLGNESLVSGSLSGELLSVPTVRMRDPCASPMPSVHFRDVVVVTDGRERARSLERSCLHTRRHPERVLVVVADECDGECVSEISVRCWGFRLMRVLVVTPRGHFTYGPECDRPGADADVTVTEATADEVFGVGRPRLNLRGCPLSVGSFSSPPYMHVHVGDGDGDLRYEGPEANVLAALSKIHNFTVRLLVLGRKWDEVFPVLHNGTVSLTSTPMYISVSRIRNATFNVYFMTRAAVVTPAAPLAPAWLKIVRPFSARVWWVVVGSSLLMASVYHVVASEGVSPLSALEMLLGNSTVLPRRRSATLGCYLWAFLVFAFAARNAYQASLMNCLFTDYFESNVDTLDEIVEADMPLAGLLEMKPNVEDHAGAAERFATVNNAVLDETLKNISRGARRALVVTTDDLEENLRVFNATVADVHITKRKLGTSVIGFYFPKNSHLADAFGHSLLVMNANGMIAKWKFVEKQFASRDKSQARGEFSVINVDHLAGAFFLYLLGVVFGALAFLCECILGYASHLGRY